MSHVFTDITDITPDRLTAILHEAGVLLGDARVASIRAESHENFYSRVHTLYPIYKGADPDSPPPSSLFLKIAPAGFANDDAGRAEVAFYDLAPLDLPVPRPYDVRYDEDTGQFHLLLADLTRSHRSLPSGLPPRRSQMMAAATALAQIHARWWGQPTDSLGVQPPTPTDFTLDTAPILMEFLAQFDDLQVTPNERRRFHRAAERAEHLNEAAQALPHTLTHGDAHFWNMLFPKGPESGVCLVDWDTWDIMPGGFDLAYTLAVFIGALRGRVERDLIGHYTGALHAAGVTKISEEDVWLSYRLGIIKMLFWPVRWWHTDHPPAVWWPRLQNILRAYDELDCDALVG